MVRRMILRGTRTAWRHHSAVAPRTGLLTIALPPRDRRKNYCSRSGGESDARQAPAELNDRPAPNAGPTIQCINGTLGLTRSITATDDRGMERSVNRSPTCEI